MKRTMRQQIHRRFVSVFELVDNLSVRIPWITMHGPKHGPSVVLIGGVHGEEVVGTAVIHRIVDEVKLARGTLYLVPAANMQGLSQGFRFVPLGETTQWGNLNREFPGDAHGNPAERIAYALWEKIAAIRPRPSVVIDMHADAHLSLAYILLDHVERKPNGSVDKEARILAEAFGVTVCRDDTPEEYLADDSERTLTGALVNRMHIPAFVVELGGPMGVHQEFVELGINGVKNVLRHLGMLKGDWSPTVDAQKIKAAYPLRTHVVLQGARSGFAQYAPEMKLGATVKRGQRIATIRDVFGRVKGEVCVPMNGFMIALGYSAVTQPGAVIATLAVKE